MADTNMSPTEVVRGTKAKDLWQPLINDTVSGFKWADVEAGAVAPTPNFENNLDAVSLTNGKMQSDINSSPIVKEQKMMSEGNISPYNPQQNQSLYNPNTQQSPAPVQRDTQPVQQKQVPQTRYQQPAPQQTQQPVVQQPVVDQTLDPTIPAGQPTGQIWGIEKSTVSASMKLADKAYKMINDSIAKGNEIDPSTRKQIIEKLAEVWWTPELAQEAMNFLSKRFEETGMDEVAMSQEEILRNQKITDGIMAFDDNTMLEAMKSSKLPVSVREAVMNSDKYKQALAKQQEDQKTQEFNDVVSGKPITTEAPTTTTDSVKESLGIADPDKATKQEIKSIASDDKLTTLSGEISWVDEEIAGLQQELKNVKTDIEAEFPTSISKSALNAFVYDRQISIDNKLQTKLAERQAKVGDYERIRQEREQELQRKLAQQKQSMDFLQANGWVALFGTSSEDLKQMEATWQIPEWYSDMYKNYQEGLIYNTLAQMWTPNGDDINVISGALDQGYTPQQILGTMSQQSRFQQQVGWYSASDMMETVKVWDHTYQFNAESGRYDIPVGANPIAWQTSPWYVEITDDTFDLFRQTPNDYEWNRGADYPAPKGTWFKAPIDWTIVWAERHSTWNIRVRMRLSDGRKMDVDHLDEKTLAHLWLDPSFTGKTSLNIPVWAGETVWFIGNTGNVKTIDPNTNQWVWVRKDGKLLRPDLNHKGVHASVEMYDQNWNMMSVKDTDTSLKNMAASHKDLSSYWPTIMSWVEENKTPNSEVLKAMWFSSLWEFDKQANKAYASLIRDDYAVKWFELKNPWLFARSDSKLKQKLNESIDFAAEAQPSFERMISLIDRYGGEVMPWVVKTEMNQLYQDILLKGKEIYNLWVLNWPDLVIMENVLGITPWSLWAKFRSKSFLKKQMENARRTFNENVWAKAENYWLSFNPEAATQRQQQEQEQQQIMNQQNNLQEFASFSSDIDNRF